MKLLLSALLTLCLVVVPASAEAKRPKHGCTKVVKAEAGFNYSRVTTYVSCPLRPRTSRG